MIIINQIKSQIDRFVSEEQVIDIALKIVGVSMSDIKSAHVTKTSVDARDKSNIKLVHSVAVHTDEKIENNIKKDPRVRVVAESVYAPVIGTRSLVDRPLVVGFGPAGMFAALTLAQHGYRPIVIERGRDATKRAADIKEFIKTGKLDVESNIQFGEGGAGTFSDGKLTTRIGDPRCNTILKQFVQCGAPAEILTKAKPHMGTDVLVKVVSAIREKIIALGGEVLFGHKLEGIKQSGGAVVGAVTSGGDIGCSHIILATGHSSRDTFKALYEDGVTMTSKPFSVGIRVEQLQSDIDKGLYGDLAGHPLLPKGEYQLSHRRGDRGVYTFCMCPGGSVVAATSEQGGIVTNGMSEFSRDGKNANAAIAVSVTSADYGSEVFDGVNFQREIERRAYDMTGGYAAPSQTVKSFLKGGASELGRITPSYPLGIKNSDIKLLFPDDINSMLRLGLINFGSKLPGFSADDVVITGPETRTSSPIRITRHENHQSVSVSGLYPAGEGAGYAGGIMSAAVDGMKAAEAIMANNAPF